VAQHSDSARVLARPWSSGTAFSPDELLKAVRRSKALPAIAVPEVCLLDFDGDLTDWLSATGQTRVCDSWACFHTQLHVFDAGGVQAGIIARTIGGPYAVLVAEQLHASGTRVILGLTSAGRISASLQLPGLVVAADAIRDEGTSHHYLPDNDLVATNPTLVCALTEALHGLEMSVTAGTVWSTDAPYRETLEQIEGYRSQGVFAVEMQAASLYAFAEARGAVCAVVAHITNAVDCAPDSQFYKGTNEKSFAIAQAMCRTASRWLSDGARMES